MCNLNFEASNYKLLKFLSKNYVISSDQDSTASTKPINVKLHIHIHIRLRYIAEAQDMTDLLTQYSCSKEPAY